MRNYDPANWYWLADDGRLFSSAASGTVSTSDAAYQAWTAADGVASPWPRDEAGAQTLDSLQEVLSTYGLYADLDRLKAALRAQIDADAEAARARHITLGSGQAMEYQQAATEAETYLSAYSADENYAPSAGAYPMLEASIPTDAATLHEAAELVAAMHAQWLAVGSSIRAARLVAKAAVTAATSAATARAAAVVDWPG